LIFGFKWTQNNCQDGLRRMFRFKSGAKEAMGQQMVSFKQEDVLEELSANDEKKFSKK
jgi:hypothetical protein